MDAPFPLIYVMHGCMRLRNVFLSHWIVGVMAWTECIWLHLCGTLLWIHDQWTMIHCSKLWLIVNDNCVKCLQKICVHCLFKGGWRGKSQDTLKNHASWPNRKHLRLVPKNQCVWEIRVCPSWLLAWKVYSLGDLKLLPVRLMQSVMFSSIHV